MENAVKTTGPLTGRTAIVTGASSGIGRATAATLAVAGAAVVINARRKDRLDKVAAEIAANGGKVLAVAGDAGSEKDIDTLLERASSWGDGGRRLDIVVVNAGRGLAGGITGSDESWWQDVYQVNVLGAAHLMRRAAKQMVGQKSGDIVVIGSVGGRNISPFAAVYSASKFAVGALAEGLRREVCAHGVRVALVMPGVVTTGFQGVAGYDEENFYKSVSQFGKLLAPQEIADAIHWLLTLPPHVNISEIIVRPTGQPYP
jgi:NADP-dependent 3-hydroxy acid dehydrogenase YdfG